MKFLASLLVIFSFSSQAAVFCVNDQKEFVDVLKAELDCQGPLLWGDGVCFTGSRSQAIRVLNSAELNQIFDGTDGEYIGNAHFNGRNAISYTSFDDANELTSKIVINRCK